LAANSAFLNQAQSIDPVVFDHLGDVYLALAQYADAIRAWEKNLESDPENRMIQEKIKKAKLLLGGR
jgi:predicted negative regulator of RcsB-dependent stress response